MSKVKAKFIHYGRGLRRGADNNPDYPNKDLLHVSLYELGELMFRDGTNAIDFRDVSGLSVLGRAPSSDGSVQDITAEGVPNGVLLHNGNTSNPSLVFRLLTDANIAAAANIKLSKLDPGTANNRILGRRNGTTIAPLSPTDTRGILFSDLSTPSVLARDTAGTYTSVSSTEPNSVLKTNAAGNGIVFGKIGNLDISDTAGISLSKLQSIGRNTFLGYAGTGTTGSVRAIGGETAWDILMDGAPQGSVFVRNQDNSHYVWPTSPSERVFKVGANDNLVFGLIESADIASKAVTLAKIQDLTAQRILGRGTSGNGAPEQLRLGSGLAFSGTTVSLGPLTSDWNLQPPSGQPQYTITNVRDPQSAGDVANKRYVDALAAGLKNKAPVYAATNGENIDLADIASAIIIDGVRVDPDSDGRPYRILLKDQTDARENGVYEHRGEDIGIVRADDFNEDSEIVSGSYVYVEEGTVNGNSGFVVITPDPIVVDLTPIKFELYHRAGKFEVGFGLDRNGPEIFVDTTANYIIDNSWTGLHTFSKQVTVNGGLRFNVGEDSSGFINGTSTPGELNIHTIDYEGGSYVTIGGGGAAVNVFEVLRPGGGAEHRLSSTGSNSVSYLHGSGGTLGIGTSAPNTNFTVDIAGNVSVGDALHVQTASPSTSYDVLRFGAAVTHKLTWDAITQQLSLNSDTQANTFFSADVLIARESVVIGSRWTATSSSFPLIEIGNDATQSIDWDHVTRLVTFSSGIKTETVSTKEIRGHTTTPPTLEHSIQQITSGSGRTIVTKEWVDAQIAAFSDYTERSVRVVITEAHVAQKYISLIGIEESVAPDFKPVLSDLVQVFIQGAPNQFNGPEDDFTIIANPDEPSGNYVLHWGGLGLDEPGLVEAGDIWTIRYNA